MDLTLREEYWTKFSPSSNKKKTKPTQKDNIPPIEEAMERKPYG
jgi:hypothetical protein